MPPKTLAKMSKTFDEAIYDETAITFYSARNTSIEELEDLILQINEMKDQTVYTRSDKDKFPTLKSESDELKSLLKKENKDLCAAIGRLNPNISNEERYKEDQKSLRHCIKGRKRNSYSVNYGSTSGHIRYSYHLTANVKTTG